MAKSQSRIRRITDQTVCIVGAGRIGSTAALMLRDIGFNVVFYDPYVAKGYEKVLNVQRSYDLNSALEISDYVSIHIPSNNNKGIVDDDNFISMMKSGSVLINTARGEILQSLDCIQRAIESNRISSVFMDVLDCEPPKQHDFLDNWKNGLYGSRVVINPHTFYSDKSFIEMRTKACTSAVSVLKDKQPYCEVNK